MEVTSHRIEVIYAAILPLYNLCYLHTLQLASERSHHGSPVPDLPASPNPKLLPYNVSGPPNRPHLASLHLIPSTHHSVEPKPIRSRPVGSRADLRRPEPEAPCYRTSPSSNQSGFGHKAALFVVRVLLNSHALLVGRRSLGRDNFPKRPV